MNLQFEMIPSQYLNLIQGSYAIKLARASNIHPIIAVAGYDGISEKNSYQNISQVLAKQGSKITLVLPGKKYPEIPDYIEKSITRVGTVHMDPSEKKAAAGIRTGEKDFGYVFFRLFSRGLQEGWFTAHPHEVVPGGLDGVEKGLLNLKEGINSATKYVFKIEDTK
jgi:NADPH:quinone reductase